MLKKLLALVLAGAMVIGSALPAMAKYVAVGDGAFSATETYYVKSGDDYVKAAGITSETFEAQKASLYTYQEIGSITVNSPIMGAKYYAYQVFKMTMDDDTNPTAFAYTIDKDDPFFKAVWAYKADESKGLILTGVESTKFSPAVDGVEYEEYTVTVDQTKFDAQAFGQAMETALKATGAAAMNPAPTPYEPTYEDSKSVVTPAKAAAIKFENLPYGYFLVTNEYDETTNPLTVQLMNGEEVFAEFDQDDYTFTKDPTTGKVTDVTVAELEAKAEALAKVLYPDDLSTAETQYKADHLGDTNVKPWESMTDTEKQTVLAQYRATAKQNAIDLVKNQVLTHASDDNATDGTVKTRLIFLDSTTPDGVINEKNELSKWDVPVNPKGYADLPDTPDHDEPKGGKNIIVGETSDHKTIYADSAEYAIGDKVHYQLSVNAVNFERTNANDATSVKQVKEYIIADYENKNMKYVPREGTGESAKYGLTVTIVKKDADGNIDDSYTKGPFDYSKWVEDKNQFFINTSKTDLATTDKDIFDNDSAVGGIVIPWVEEMTQDTANGETEEAFLARVASTPNVFTNTPFTKADGDAGVDEVPAGENAADYFLDKDAQGNEKYFKKVPVYAEVKTLDGNAPEEGKKYKLLYGDNTEYDWVPETVEGTTKYYLVTDKGTENQKKVQQLDTNGQKVWATETHYFKSKYDNDVTILVDYWMELLDTADIDGEGNKNTSQFGVNYVEPQDNEYEFGLVEKPGETPPEEPKTPSEKKEQDDAKVYTYAIALKKVDPAGTALVGAKFKFRGLTTTEKSKGWYKVDTYSHADNADYGTELETDDNGLLVIEGLPAKWPVVAIETEAPEGYNRLTAELTLKPFKTGEAVETTSTVTYTDVEGNESSVTTTTKQYKNASGTIVATVVTVGTKTTYYAGDVAEANIIKADDETVPEADRKNAEQKFNDLIAQFANVQTSETTLDNNNIATMEVINNRGTELPSTGGIGTTIFYAGGAILVLLAGVLLVSKRRYA